MDSKNDSKQVNDQDFNISITNEHNEQDTISISEVRTTKTPISGLNKNNNKAKHVSSSFSKINKLNRNNKYSIYENSLIQNRNNNIKVDCYSLYSNLNNAKNISSLYRSKSNQSFGSNELYIEVSNNYLINVLV